MISKPFVTRRTESFTETSPISEDRTETLVREECTEGENGFNATIATYFLNLIGLVDVIEKEVIKLEGGSRQMAGLASAISRHDSNIRGVVGWSACDPSGSFVEELADRHSSAVAGVGARSNVVLAKLFSDFTAAVNELNRTAQDISSLRGMFDTSEDPPATVELQFETLTRIFAQQDRECGTYGLIKVGLRNGGWDPAEQLARASVARLIVANMATITDLDRLRFEYAEFGIKCPLPRSFSTGKHSRYFSNGELNRGSYQWAILPDEMLAILDGLHEDVTSELGRNLSIAGVYLNPRRIREVGGSSESEHQYGRAIELESADFNGDGTIDGSDWNLLKTLVDRAGPTSVEDINISGAGHIHAEWSQVQL